MATPFCVFKTLTGFGFQLTKVLSHFRELVLLQLPSKRATREILKALLRNAFKISLGLGLSANSCR
jgi:hypothetical protein